MNTKDIVFDLCSACGVSGREESAAHAAEKYFSEFADVSRDSNGNLYAFAGNSKARKTILLDAHIDRIGLMVTDIDKNGFAKVDACGGIDARTLRDAELVVQGNSEIIGTVCCMPPHLSDGKEDSATPISKTYVDFGMSRDKLSQVLNVGDMLTFRSRPEMLLNNRIACACLDNRSGVASLALCARLISEYRELKYKVVFLLSSQEETYGTGAVTGAYKINADEAIAVDVSFASQPDITGQYSRVELGGGPMICVSPILNKEMSDKLINIAHDKSIPYQLEPISGRTGTNADHIAVSRGGVKTALISIPQRYMHSPCEVVSIEDVENTARLAAEYIISGGAFNV